VKNASLRPFDTSFWRRQQSTSGGSSFTVTLMTYSSSVSFIPSTMRPVRFSTATTPEEIPPPTQIYNTMSDPIVEARLKALEDQIHWWRKPAPSAWREMKDAPKDRDILATIQEVNGVAVRVVFYQPYHTGRDWRSITGQRIAPGCMLAWMPMPEPFTPAKPEPALKIGGFHLCDKCRSAVVNGKSCEKCAATQFGPGAASNVGQAGGDAHGKSSPATAVVNSPDHTSINPKT